MGDSFAEKLTKISWEDGLSLTRRAKCAASMIGELPTMGSLVGGVWSISPWRSPVFRQDVCGAWPLGHDGWLYLFREQLAIIGERVTGSGIPSGLVSPSLGDLAAAEVLLAALMEDRVSLRGQLGALCWTDGSHDAAWFQLSDGHVNFSLGVSFPLGAEFSCESTLHREFAFRVSLVAGFLPLEALNGCHPGDVVFTGWPVDGKYWCGNGDTYLPVNLSDEGMSKRGEIVEKPELSKRMPVDIIVEAGRLVLKGEELDTLVAGAVLPLGVSPSGQVNLVHDGRIIARGELLVAGDELAVRILE